MTNRTTRLIYTSTHGTKTYSIIEGKEAEAQVKLGRLEDIEEERHIDLTMLFTTKYVYVKYWSNNVEKIREMMLVSIDLLNNVIKCFNDEDCSNYYKLFKDYGTIWAATREELE